MVSEFNSQMLRFGFLFFFFFFPCLRDKSFGEGCRGRQVLEEEEKKKLGSLWASVHYVKPFFFFFYPMKNFMLSVLYTCKYKWTSPILKVPTIICEQKRLTLLYILKGVQVWVQTASWSELTDIYLTSLLLFFFSCWLLT